VVLAAAAVEQFVAIFPRRSEAPTPFGDTDRVVGQFITLSFMLLALAVALALFRSAQSAARRPVFALPDERGPFADGDDFDDDPDV